MEKEKINHLAAKIVLLLKSFGRCVGCLLKWIVLFFLCLLSLEVWLEMWLRSDGGLDWFQEACLLLLLGSHCVFLFFMLYLPKFRWFFFIAVFFLLGIEVWLRDTWFA